MHSDLDTDHRHRLDNNQSKAGQGLDSEGDPDNTRESGQQVDQTKRHVKTEVYSRIVGYLRPVQNWNKAKKEEFKQRKNYVIEIEEEAK